MKVLKIIHTMGHGGAENIFRWLAWGLRRNGVEVVAGIPEYNPALDTEDWITPALKDLGIPYMTFDKSGGPVSLVRNMMALIRKAGPDVVHSHLLDSNFYASVACRLLSIPHVCTEHGDISFKRAFQDRAKFYMLSALSQSVICVSESLRKAALKSTISPGRLGMIYNGINLPERTTSSFRAEFSIPADAFLIGNVANLYPVKGQKHLVEAFSSFISTVPGAYLIIVGRGGSRDELEAVSRSLGIPGGRVIFTGFRGDVPNIVGSLDLYVQPSLSEGLPVSILEVMSMGVPVIATDVGGVSEIIGRNERGTLVPPGSTEALLEKMLEACRDISAYRARAAAAAAFVEENFSLSMMASRYMNEYKKTLGWNIG